MGLVLRHLFSVAAHMASPQYVFRKDEHLHKEQVLCSLEQFYRGTQAALA